MPFMKPGQPWLYDEDSQDIIGIKDADGSERMFMARRKTEVFWSGIVGLNLAADTDYNLVALLKGLPAPQFGTLAPFFNTATDKMNAFNEGTTLTFKVNIQGTWTGATTNCSMSLDFVGTNGNRLVESRDQEVTLDVLTLATFFSVDANGSMVNNGTTPILRSNGRPFAVSAVLLIAEQATSRKTISAV